LEDASIQLKNQKETITTLKETISYLQERLNFEQFEKSKYIEELRKVEGKKTNLAYEKVQLQNKITELEQKINSLHEDIESEKKLTKNVTGNNQRQLDAFFYRLSENLKFEYEDFKDALEADMSISLGENMRTQLGNVFKILSDSGIKLE
jgi:chromosome segregation ATPase